MTGSRLSARTKKRRHTAMERYMILLKPGGKCRLIPCDKDGTLTL